MKLTEAGPAHLIKLASLAQHVEEFFATAGSLLAAERKAADFDRAAIAGLLRDPQVRELLDDPANAVYLPVKR